MRNAFFLALTLIVTLLSAQTWADTIAVNDIIYFGDGPGSPGGEFYIGKNPGVTAATSLFSTFCLEKYEYMYFDVPFKVTEISDRAYLGGIDNSVPADPAPGDPISEQTAFLYTAFRQGTLSGYNGSVSSVNSFQNAIWFLEGEITSVGSDTQAATWISLANSKVMSNEWDGLGNVRVMNLVWAQNWGSFKVGDKAQDQLVLVPEPSTLLLLGSGIIGVGIFARRRMKA